MISLESGGFVLDNGPAFDPANDVLNVKDSNCVNVISSNVPKSAYVFPFEIPL